MVVADVVVELIAVKFCKVVEPITRRSPDELMVVVAEPPILNWLAVICPLYRLVEVADVVVEREMSLKTLVPVQVKLSVSSIEKEPEEMLTPLPP